MNISRPLTGLAGFAAMALAQPAIAQDRTFDIPAQAAVTAIPMFGRQAGIQIVAPAAQLGGKRTPAVSGTMPVDAALKLLLVDSGLEVASQTGSIISLRAVRPVGPRAAGDPTGQIFLPDEIVVTGTRTGRAKFTSPFSVSTIDKRRIADDAPRSVADLLKATPGLTVEASGGEGGGENIVVRGLPFSGWRLLDFLQDGMPLFESNYERFVNIDEAYRVDLDTQRAEVVRGGTAPIYSDNASGGVVNFITGHGTDKLDAALRLETGTGNRARVDGAISGPLSERLSATVSGFYRRDDGLRRAGYSGADDGGQIKFGATYRLDHGKVFADVKYLNDRSIFYTAVPLTDPRPGATFGQSLSDLIDPTSGTLNSAAFRTVTLRTTDASGAPTTTNRDLRDGIHPAIITATLGGNYDLGSGFTVTDTYRHTGGSINFNGIFNGASPSDATTFLASQLTRAKTGFGASVVGARYVLANTNTAYDPATTRGLVMVNNWNSINTDLRYDANDFHVQKSLDTPIGKHDLTGGIYYSTYHYAQKQSLNALLMNVRNQASPLDIQALDATGAVVGNVTENGFVSYGSGSIVGSLDGEALAFYAADTWHPLPGWSIDIGYRNVDRSQHGLQGVLGTVNAVPTGPLAARNVQGVVSTIARSEDLKGSSLTVGTGYEVSSHFNAFARYSRSFSFPRFDTIVAGALLPGGGPIPVTRIEQYEGGLRLALRHLQLAAVGFYSKFKDLNSGTQVADTNGNIVTSNILFDTETKGVEVEGNWSPLKGFEITASGIYQDPRLTNVLTLTGVNAQSVRNKEISRTPRVQASIEPSYSFGVRSLDARLFATFYTVGRRFQDFSNLSVLPAYSTLDLGLTLKHPSGIEVRTLVGNVTNAIGLTEGNARGAVLGSGTVGNATVGRSIFGRTFTLSLTKHW